MDKATYDADGDGVVDKAPAVPGMVTGKPGTFTPSTHTHDDRYYTETEMNQAGRQGQQQNTRTPKTRWGFPKGQQRHQHGL
ncbi:MAG: hypothetical protein ACLRI7_15130 [Ruthenibacterium lactatiformans]